MEAGATYLAATKHLWSVTPTSNHVTTLAESMINRNFLRIDEYEVRRIGEHAWEVPFVGMDQEPRTSTDRRTVCPSSPIPKYSRLRVVTLDNGYLLCPCCLHERVRV